MLTSILIVLVGILWVLSPLILIAFSIRDFRRIREMKTWQRAWYFAVAIAVVVDLASFLIAFARGLIGGFGTHNMTTFAANWFMVGSFVLLAAAIATKISRGKLMLASFLVLALWMGSAMVA
jgi:hypothetical protein